MSEKELINKLKIQKKILIVKPSRIISMSYNQKADNSLKADYSTCVFTSGLTLFS